MSDYKSLYFTLTGKVADAIELLIQAQQAGEDSCTNGTLNDFSLGKEDREDEKDDSG
jgi:hypothetical protein